MLPDESPEPITDPATIAADEADAAAEHRSDRAPTPDEEEAADRAASAVDPASGEVFEEAARRGAAVQGEGQIVPD